MKVKKIEYLNGHQRSRRKLKITLDNGRIIYAESCHESWEQWGGTTEELYVTLPIVEAHNAWLHGGAKPYEE
jgi:hypothetical protein